MRSTLPFSLAIIVAGAAVPEVAGQATFTLIPTQAGLDVTVDEFGRTLVLTSENGYPGPLYVWEAGSLTYIADGVGSGISEDGNAISGSFWNLDGRQVAGRWTQNLGWEELGVLPCSTDLTGSGETGFDDLTQLLGNWGPCGFCPEDIDGDGLVGFNDLTTLLGSWGPCLNDGCGSLSSGYRMSADGETIVGLGWEGCRALGFRWTPEGGMKALAEQGNGTNRASCVSADGQVIGGFAQGFTRTPCAWLADGSVHPTFPFDINAGGEIWAATADGSTLAGQRSLWVEPGDGSPAFYWNETEGVVEIGWLDNDGVAMAYDISDDGNTIVGSSGTVFTGGFDAFIWTRERGMEKLRNRLIELGAAGLEEVVIGNAFAMTGDGLTITGYAHTLDENDLPIQRGFVATLPAPE